MPNPHTLARLARAPRCASLLVAIALLLSGSAGQAAPPSGGRAPRIASPAAQRRTQLRDALRASNGRWVPHPQAKWVPLKMKVVGRELQVDRPPNGMLDVRAHGRAVVVSAYVPEMRDGKPGFRVDRLVGTREPGQRTSAVEAKKGQASFASAVHVLHETYHQPIEHAATFQKAMKKIAEGPVADAPTLYRSGIEGALSGHDRYTRYLAPEDWRRMQEEQTGGFAGIGVTSKFLRRTKEIRVDRVMRGSPAAAAGLRRGDVIVSVDGQAHDPADPGSTLKRIRGDAGKPVSIEVRRNGERLTLTAVRQRIDSHDVVGKKTRDGFGVIKLRQFDEQVAQKIANEVVRMKPKGVVLDLRNNPGGLTTEAVSVVALFAKKAGEIARFKEIGGKGMAYTARSPGPFAHLPLVVLVNGHSASGAELVSGALQESGRALIVGDKTYGKGVQQQYMPLPDGGGFAVTNAQYFTPTRSPDGQGVMPELSSAEAKQRARAVNRRAVDPILHGALGELRRMSAGASVTPVQPRSPDVSPKAGYDLAARASR